MQKSITARASGSVKQDLPVFIAFVKVFWIAQGYSRLELMKLFFFTFWKRILRHTSFRSPFMLHLTTPHGTAAVRVRDMADITTVYAVFSEGEYDIPYPENEVRTVLDLGSNIGVSVAYFRLRYPSAHIYAVEADPATFKRLEENCSGMDKITLLHAAISDKTGPVEFHSNESSVSGSLYGRVGNRSSNLIHGFTIDDLVTAHHIGSVDILKFDIEGAEFDAFPMSPRTLREARVVMGEVHPDIGNRSAQALLNLFSGYAIEIATREKGRFILKASRSVTT